MSEYKEELDKMRWSFSRVKSYVQCAYQFYLKYIVGENEVGNFYAYLGKEMHKCLESILKKERTIDEAIDIFQECLTYFDDYDVNEKIKMNAYEKCMDFLCVLDLSELERYNILGVELEIKLNIDGYDYIGYIDLLIEDKVTGDIIIIDHKSSEYPLKRNGEVLKNHAKEFEYYKKQMYLYCNGVKQIYGKYPRKIAWNHFKENKIAVIDFDENEYNSSMKWFLDTIHTIEKDKAFVPNIEFFFCSKLCGFRYECEYKGD